MLRILAIAVALAVGACAVSSGVPADGFANPRLADAYLPLSAPAFLFGTKRGAALIVAPHVAVTNAHNLNLIDPESVIGTSQTYDLAFFHTDKTGEPVPTARPRVGEQVLAFGEGTGGELRVAHGVVTALEAPVEPRCASCAEQTAFTFVGDAGEGFSGGPVVDAADGRVVGIVFGYTEGHPRTIYAYSAERVASELSRVESRLPHDVD